MWIAFCVLAGFVSGLVVAVVMLSFRVARIEDRIDRTDRGTRAVAESAHNLDQVLRQIEAAAKSQIQPDPDEVGVDRACFH